MHLEGKAAIIRPGSRATTPPVCAQVSVILAGDRSTTNVITNTAPTRRRCARRTESDETAHDHTIKPHHDALVREGELRKRISGTRIQVRRYGLAVPQSPKIGKINQRSLPLQSDA